MEDGIDPITGIPVVSLYGKHKKPSPEELEGVDLERIPIYLNRDEALGLKGAAIHAWKELTASSSG